MIRKLLLRGFFTSDRYWKWRYRYGGRSGDGSYGDHCAAKARVLNQIIEEFQIIEAIEFGCGDGNQLQFYKIESYLGLDISPDAVRRCIQAFQGDDTKSFMSYDPAVFLNNGRILKAQAVWSIDVIFHLVEDRVFEEYMRNLFSAAQSLVIISSSDHDNNDGACKHVRHRRFSGYVRQHFPSWTLAKKFACVLQDGREVDSFHVFRNQE